MTQGAAEPPRPVSHWVVPVLAVAFALGMVFTSGGFFEADEITHYLYAKAVWHDWRNLVSIWGRMGATGLYALGTPLGPTGSRLIAVGVMALTGWGTCRLLRRVMPAEGRGGFFRRHATALVWLLLFAQPCFLLNCYTVMTEMLLACAWVWALNALGARRVVLASLLLGLGGLMRPEGWIAIAAWPVCLALWPELLSAAGKRRNVWILFCTFLAGLPPLAWYLLGAIGRHDAKWFVSEWPWSPSSQYGKSGLLFALSCFSALAIWMWIPVARGAWTLWKNRRRSPEPFRILVLPAAGFFLLHGTLGTLGLFGSMSLPRYYVAIAPLVSVLALLGLIELEAHTVKARRLRRAAIALCLTPLAGLILFGYIPMRPVVEQRRLEVVVQAVEARGIGAGGLIAEHPYISLRLNKDPDDKDMARIFSPQGQAIADAPAGTLLITDSMVWVYEHRPTPAELRAWGYVEDAAVAAAVDAVPEPFELLTMKPRGSEARVRLWIKQ